MGTRPRLRGNVVRPDLEQPTIRIDHTNLHVVEDDVYGPGWNGDTTHAPSQNALYDKIETLLTGVSEDILVYGFAIMFMPTALGLFYQDDEYDVRLREASGTAGENLLIPQGFRQNGTKLEVFV